MAEYNILYLELIKRLSILKAKLPYLNSLEESEKEEYRKVIDLLLKKLPLYMVIFLKYHSY